MIVDSSHGLVEERHVSLDHITMAELVGSLGVSGQATNSAAPASKAGAAIRWIDPIRSSSWEWPGGEQ